jgi:uncharacterized protein (TIGR00730 family)
MNDEHMNIPAKDLPAQPRKHDFRESFQWRVFRIMAEFVEGFQFLADYKKMVSIFGSARFKENDPWYREAQRLGAMLTKEGFSIVTGGGPGIMEAANRGAIEGDGEQCSLGLCSVGLNIELIEEQRRNPYIQKGPGFHYFFTRKVMLSYAAQAYVFFPGGLGTLDEFFEIVTLIQTKKISKKIPVVLIGRDFWSPLLEWIDKTLYGEYNTVDEEDKKLYTLVDSIGQAFEIVKHSKPREDIFAHVD